jgi:hypothetical protein
MEQIYWSIDDFVGWRCKPDDDFWDVLATLRDQVLRGKIEITGWRCSWDQSGGDCDTDKVRQPIPALSIEDLKFEVLPDNSDFVLIHHGSTWRSKSYGHVTWTKGEYDERFGPSDRDRIHGWRELRMRADQVHAISGDADPEPTGGGDRHSALERIPKQTKAKAVKAWILKTYPKGIPADTTNKGIARDFETAKAIRVDVRTVRRARGGK